MKNLILLSLVLTVSACASRDYVEYGEHDYETAYVVDEVAYGGTIYSPGYSYGPSTSYSVSYYDSFGYGYANSWYDPYWYPGSSFSLYYGVSPGYYLGAGYSPYWDGYGYGYGYGYSHAGYYNYSPYDRYGYHLLHNHYGYHHPFDYYYNDNHHDNFYGRNRNHHHRRNVRDGDARNEALRLTNQSRNNRRHALDSGNAYTRPGSSTLR